MQLRGVIRTSVNVNFHVGGLATTRTKGKDLGSGGGIRN